MDVYIEYIIIENFIINFFLILFISIFTKQKLNILRILFTDVITVLYVTVAHIYNLDNAIYKLFLSFVTVFIAFGMKSYKKYIKIVVYYYLIYFEYIGVVLSITLIFNFNIDYLLVKIIVYLLSAGLTYIFNKFMWKIWKVDIKNKDLKLKVKVNGILFSAFVDTGNSVKMENGFPVIFIKKCLKNRIIKNDNVCKCDVNIITINSKEKMEAYVIDNVSFIKNKSYSFKKANIIFSNMLENLDYDALISYDTYIDNLEGGTL